MIMIMSPTEFGATKYRLPVPAGSATKDQIEKFAEDFLNNKLTPYHKSAPIPKGDKRLTNDGTIVEVVGKTWESQVRSGNYEVFV